MDETIRQVMLREIADRKIPISLGKKCPVKCAFCYELDHSYRKTYDVPLTSPEEWRFIINTIRSTPDSQGDSWVWGGNEYMEWTDLFLHPRALDWMEEFLETTHKKITQGHGQRPAASAWRQKEA